MDSSQRPVVFSSAKLVPAGHRGPQSLTNNHPSTAVKQRMETSILLPTQIFSTFGSTWLLTFGDVFFSPPSVRDTLRIQAYLGFSGMSMLSPNFTTSTIVVRKATARATARCFGVKYSCVFFCRWDFLGCKFENYTPQKINMEPKDIGGVVSTVDVSPFSFLTCFFRFHLSFSRVSNFGNQGNFCGVVEKYHLGVCWVRVLFYDSKPLISHLIAISNDFGHPHMKKNKIKEGKDSRGIVVLAIGGGGSPARSAGNRAAQKKEAKDEGRGGEEGGLKGRRRRRTTLQGIDISHLGKRKIIFKMPIFGGIC